MRGGHVYRESTAAATILRAAGLSGMYWSNTTRSNTNAGRLDFSYNVIYPRSGNLRSLGHSLRCVALNIPIPKIKVLSIAHYSSSAEASSTVALWATQVTVATIGLALCSPIPTPVTCLSIVVVPVCRLTTSGSTDFLSAA